MAYKQLPIAGPWGGIVNDVGKPNAPLNAFDDCINYFTTKGRIQSRPKLTAYGAAPDGRTVLLTRSFKDVNGNYHSVLLTDTNAYALTAGPTYNVLTFPAGTANLGANVRPFAVEGINRRLYFSNGSNAIQVLFTDGSSALAVAGNVPGGARYMGILANRLVLAYCNEGSVDFPNRVRWSKSGDPNNWTDFSAGYADLMEVPDDITGFALSGRNGLVFRQSGISLMAPTGIGVNPFSFEHFSMEPKGVGNFYPYSLATYGNLHVCFVAQDDIYRVNGAECTPIGGHSKKDIFSDISTASGTITGTIIANLGVAYDFLSYWLVIPQASAAATKVWIYQFDDQTWVKANFSTNGTMTSLGTVYTA